MKTGRRQSRDTAFLYLFEWGFREDEPASEIFETAKIGREAEPDEFARALVERTIEHRAEIDAIIERYSTKWKIPRIPRVTLTVLRLALCEMTKFDDIPVGATINEAVELVKLYASEEDASYLNGILGQFERDRTGGGKNPAKAGNTAKKDSEPELAADKPSDAFDAAELDSDLASSVPDSTTEAEAMGSGTSVAETALDADTSSDGGTATADSVAPDNGDN